jgi:hypothetical protein
MGNVRFGAPTEFILWLKNAFGHAVFVETGTNQAASAAWAAQHFRHVWTIEGEARFVEAARRKLADKHNIDFILGDSRTCLRPILDDCSQPAIVWLDAHWCGTGTFGDGAECPVLDELREVNESHPDHIVLVDDARLFIAPVPIPHKPEHWPSLKELLPLLTCPSRDRYVVVHEDVVVAVPERHRLVLMEYLRSQGKPEERVTVAQGLRRMARRLLGRA